MQIAAFSPQKLGRMHLSAYESGVPELAVMMEECLLTYALNTAITMRPEIRRIEGEVNGLSINDVLGNRSSR